jgi:putative flavoprotein involved in K+ transport
MRTGGDVLPAQVDTVVVGAGQAGLAMSWWLTQAGRDHVVLEARDRLGGGWLRRWDSFCLVTPNWSMRLPGFAYDGPEPDAFMPRDGLVAYIADYARSFDAPVILDCAATRVDAVGGGGLEVQTPRGTITARNVVVATGAFQVAKRPAISADLPEGVLQVHTDEYRNPAQLPDGAVLVVGSGQSGCQVAEELHDAGRRVFLAVSSCWRAPRTYRGHDTFWWLAQRGMRAAEFGIAPETVDDLPHPGIRAACNPHLSGTKGGHTINLRRFGQQGITLLGHLSGADDGHLRFAADLEQNLWRADTFFDDNLRPDLDEFIAAAGYDAPAYEPDVVVVFDPPPVDTLDIAKEGITSVVWGTGFRFDLGWVRQQHFDDMGFPLHRRGVTDTPGLYLLGLPWLYTQTSSLLVGVGADAQYLAEHIAART